MIPKGKLNTPASLPDCPLTANRAFIPLTTRPKGEGVTLNVLYDSGAQASLLNGKDFAALKTARVPFTRIDSEGFNLTAANNSAIRCSLVILVELYTPTSPITVPFFVCPDANTSILGINAIRKFNLVLDPVALTADVDGRQTNICQLKVVREPQVRLAQQIDLDPQSVDTRALAQLTDEHGNEIRGERTIAVSQGITCALVNVNARGRCRVPVVNATNTGQTLNKNEMVGTASDIFSEVYISAVALRDKTLTAPPPRKHTEAEKAKIMLELTSKINPDVPRETRDKLLRVLREFEDVFSADKDDIGFCPLREHTINLTDNRPVFRAQYRLSSDHLMAIKNQIAAWQALGIVKRGDSPYNNPIFAVPKPGGRGLRVVLDFRALNVKTLPDKFCIPSVDEILGVIGDSGAKYFSSLDLTSGFYHIPVKPEHQHYTAFTLPGQGQYIWTRAAMGLTGSPSSFCRAVCEILHDVEGCLSYVDDLLCFSKDTNSHIVTLTTMLTRLRKGGLKISTEKSSFLQTKLTYLGAEISEDGVRPTMDKTKAVRNLAPPDSKKQLAFVLGFFNYMSRYIYHYAAKIAPLQRLQRGESTWKGGDLPPAALESFQRVKRELTSRPVVGYMRGDAPLHLYVDAALGGQRDVGKGFGAAVLQDTPGGIRRPVAYLSRQLKTHEENYPAGLAELKATMWAIDKLSHHLKHRPFFLYSDHKPLIDKMLGPNQQKKYSNCETFIEDHYPIWRHVNGKANVIADFLSRFHGMRVGAQRRQPPRPANPSPLPPPGWNRKADSDKSPSYARTELNIALVTHSAVNLLATDTSMPRIRWLQRHDETCIDILKEIGGQCATSTPDDPVPATTTHLNNPVTVWKNILMVKPSTRNDTAPLTPPRTFRIYAPFAMRTELLVQAHGGPIPFGGHFGVDKTLNRLTRDFYWPNMRADCEKMCKECDVCNLAMDKNIPPPPPARSIQAPTLPGVIIQMDLQGPVHSRKYGRNSYLLGIIDTFSKHLTLRLTRGKKAEDVVPQLYKYCMVMGIPKQILTDRGGEFNNTLETEMCKRLGIQRLRTAAYHPQTNGLAEEANKTIQNFIRKARNTHEREPSDFEDFILPLQFSYNTSRHSRTRVAPFEAMFGYSPRHPAVEDYSDVFAARENPERTHSAYITRHLRALDDFRRLVVENQQDAQEETREQHDARTGARFPLYEPRQPICIRNFYKGPINPKFINKWTEGWILKQTNVSTYLVYVKDGGRGGRGIKKIINAKDIKPAANDRGVWLSKSRCTELKNHNFNTEENTSDANTSQYMDDHGAQQTEDDPQPGTSRGDDSVRADRPESQEEDSGLAQTHDFLPDEDGTEDEAPPAPPSPQPRGILKRRRSDPAMDEGTSQVTFAEDEHRIDDLVDNGLAYNWGPGHRPHKRGLRPGLPLRNDEIDRRQPHRGRPRKTEHPNKRQRITAVATHYHSHRPKDYANMDAQIDKLLRTEKGQERVFRDVGTGRLALHSEVQHPAPGTDPGATDGNTPSRNPEPRQTKEVGREDIGDTTPRQGYKKPPWYGFVGRLEQFLRQPPGEPRNGRDAPEAKETDSPNRSPTVHRTPQNTTSPTPTEERRQELLDDIDMLNNRKRRLENLWHQRLPGHRERGTDTPPRSNTSTRTATTPSDGPSRAASRHQRYHQKKGTWRHTMKRRLWKTPARWRGRGRKAEKPTYGTTPRSPRPGQGQGGEVTSFSGRGTHC